MRAALYLRVSTAAQAGADHVSLTVQEETCRAVVTRAAGEVVIVLRDEGRSGLDTDRPAYLQLFELARRKEIDTVIGYRFDRLGRDAGELISATKRLDKLGVKVVSATEPSDNSLVAGLLALLAEDESNRIRARTVPAMLSRLREGKWVTAAPLGYDNVPAAGGGTTLRPNADAPLVARLFTSYAEGKKSLRDLAIESAAIGLNDGKGLDRTRLSRLLRNPAYTGRSVWGRTEKLGPRHHQRRLPQDWYDFPGLHVGLVTPELFAQVQRMLGHNKERQGPPPPTRLLLIGRLRCGSCGSPMQSMQRKTSRYPDKVYYSYKCAARHERSGCTQQSVAVHLLDDQVKDLMASTFTLQGAEARRRAEALLRDQRDEYLDGMSQRKVQLERSLRRHESDQRTLTRKLARGVVTERAYLEAYGEMERIASSIRAELADLAHITVPDLGAALAAIADIDWADLDQEEWRELVLGFCARIEAHGREVRVTWEREASSLARALTAV